MKKLKRTHRFKNYGDLSTLPNTPALTVAQDETFIIETIDTGDVGIFSETDCHKPCGPLAWNPCTGPIYVEGIQADDVIAIRIEDLTVQGHCKIGIGKETLLPAEHITPRTDFIRIEEGYAHFPGQLKAPIQPMLGCIGVVPAQTAPDPWHHGGNMDLPFIQAGSTVHIRAQREGAWFCCGDGHALQGDGEVNGYALEVSLEAKITITRSAYAALRTILVETAESFITVGIESGFDASIKSAVHGMTDFFAGAHNVSVLEAYQFISHVGNLRVGPVWEAIETNSWQDGLPIPACFEVRKSLFHI